MKITRNVRADIRRAMKLTLRHEGIRGKIDIICTNEVEMCELNMRMRSIKDVTDVLSFPSGEDKYLGDIAICLPVVEQHAREYGHTLRRELKYMVVHAVLHLLGYDHQDDGKEKAVMRAREKQIMQKLGEDT